MRGTPLISGIGVMVTLGLGGCADQLPPLDQYSHSITGRVSQVELVGMPRIYITNAQWTPGELVQGQLILQVGEAKIFVTDANGSVHRRDAKDIPVGALLTAYTNSTIVALSNPPEHRPEVVSVTQ